MTPPISARNRPSRPAARDVRGRAGGIGRATSRAAERVSDDLRLGRGPMLDRRRRAAGLLVGAAGAMGIVTLYQVGLLRHLPDPPLPGFDSDRVDASGEAYVELQTPDAPLALASYGVSVALVAMGSASRAEERPWIPVVAGAKVVADAVGAGILTVEQVSKHRALCSWCLAAAGLTAAAVPQVLPETRAALRAWRGGR